MAHVLVVDDEPSICWAFRNVLGDDGHRVSIAASAEQALDQIAAGTPDLVFLDVRLPGMDGLTALERMRSLHPSLPIVIMTAHGTVKTAVGAVRGGALDYLPKPFDLAQVRHLVERVLQPHPAARSEPDTARSARATGAGEIVGQSRPMQMVFKQIAVAAACSEPVLITGESGTGKELVARAIHQHGDRASQPFLPIHLAALPESLIERELFGHERGAYTGAESDRPGLLDRTGRGTVFFDEIGEAPPSIQPKLLRVLDGGEYRSVGGGPEKRLTARIIAATNRDLTADIQSGAFRADLFYRLGVLPICVPPLRERRDDILPLWDHFLGRIRSARHDPIDPRSPLARILLHHGWPGNVRELRNVAEYAAQMSRGLPIEAEHLPATVREARTLPGRLAFPDELDAAIARWTRNQLGHLAADESDLYERFLRAIEGSFLREVRVWASGNQARMARVLGIHRTTLRQKLRQQDAGTAEGSEPANGSGPD